MRIAIYARVSTSKSAGKQDPEMQLELLRKYAMDRGWTVFSEYVDYLTGSREDRPALNRMMDDARKRKFNAVVVWKFDRFARSSRHLVNTLYEFDQLRVQFISYTENFDTQTPMGKAMFAIIAAMAELERNLIQERVSAGVKRGQERRLGSWGPRAGYIIKDGRKAPAPKELTPKNVMLANSMTVRQAADFLGIGRESARRLRKRQPTMAHSTVVTTLTEYQQ